MATAAVYINGESKLPQARPASAVEPVYLDGESGKLPILIYVAVGQFARPISDVSAGGWVNEAASAVNLYASIDEVAASDADYIRSGAAPVNDATVIGLGSLSTPAAGTVTINLRAKYV